MKKPIVISHALRVLSALVLVSALIALMPSRAHAQVVASALSSEPSSVYLSNSNYRNTGRGSDGTQARKTSDSDWKGVYQAFTWTTGDSLSSVGFLVSPSFTTSVSASFVYTATQTWTVDILELKSSGDGHIMSTVSTQTFSVPASAIVAGEYLNLAFSTPVSLTNGVTYAISLYPSENVNQRVLFAIGSAGTKSALGGGQTLGGDSTTFNFPAATSDLTFYITTTSAIPEPSTTAAILGLAVLGCAGVLRLRRKLAGKSR